MKLLAESIIWLFVIDLFVLVHFWIIERRGKEPNHAISFVLVFIWAAALSYTTYDEWTFRIISVIYLGLMYWVVFNLKLNIFRKKDLLHLGTKAILDRFEASLKNPGMTLGLKIVLMIMCSFILLDIQWP